MDIFLVVDTFACKALYALFEEGDYRILAAASSIDQALALLDEMVPALIILDPSLAGPEGEQSVKAIKQACAATEILLLADPATEDSLFALLKAGAAGYIRKDAPPWQTLAAVEEIRKGGAPISTAIARRILLEFQRYTGKEELKEVLSPLSARETEVLDLLYRGFNYQSIADQLFISFSTVHSHTKSIYTKLQVNSRSEAIYEALRRKLLR